MSFLFGGRPQLSSEQKIAAAEAEIDMVSDMYSRYARPFNFAKHPASVLAMSTLALASNAQS